MRNDWKKIWNKRCLDIEKIDIHNRKEVFLELKRSNGFDIVAREGGLAYEALYEQFELTKKNLWHSTMKNGLESVYEVGCGSGANLYLFEGENIKTGGIDYSEGLIEIAHHVLQTEDLTCGEALAIPDKPEYDSVFSNSVFSYFEDELYAEEILKKMCRKAKYSMGILDIHDVDKKEKFMEFRKEITPDYEERYKNLPKLFYSRSFFEKFAREYNLEVKFLESNMKGYWNNQFVFHCFFYKK